MNASWWTAHRVYYAIAVAVVAALMALKDVPGLPDPYPKIILGVLAIAHFFVVPVQDGRMVLAMRRTVKERAGKEG